MQFGKFVTIAFRYYQGETANQFIEIYNKLRGFNDGNFVPLETGVFVVDQEENPVFSLLADESFDDSALYFRWSDMDLILGELKSHLNEAVKVSFSEQAKMAMRGDEVPIFAQEFQTLRLMKREYEEVTFLNDSQIVSSTSQLVSVEPRIISFESKSVEPSQGGWGIRAFCI